MTIYWEQQQQEQQQQWHLQQQQSSELIPDESIVPPAISQEEDDAFMSGEEAPDGVVQSTVDSPRLSPTGEQLKVPSNGHIKYGEPYTHCITHYHTCFVWFILIACLVVASYLLPVLVTFSTTVPGKTSWLPYLSIRWMYVGTEHERMGRLIDILENMQLHSTYSAYPG